MKVRMLAVPMRNQRGVAAIMVAVVLGLIIGFGALAVDLGHLYVARNELQNAADAGALAGARVLYNEDGTAVQEIANAIARDAATANSSEGVPVEVNWTGGNEGDVERGHWCFATRTFTPNASLLPVELWNVSEEELDANLDFINAIRVVTRRQQTGVASLFARIFGRESFQLSAEAVAYIGFAGTLTPYDVDQPIAICQDAILDNGQYTCNIGRMINSGQNVANSETGGWTSFSQDSPCTGGTNAQEVRDLICRSGNPDSIILGELIATNGGEIQTAFQRLTQCWVSNADTNGDGEPDSPWNLTLPVVTCPGNNIGTCELVVGAVNINIIWINEQQDPHYREAPTQMGNWSYPPNADNSNGLERWQSFVAHFHLQNVDGTPAPYQDKAIYFLPDCTPHEPVGTTGGDNFGVLARIPVLVQ